MLKMNLDVTSSSIFPSLEQKPTQNIQLKQMLTQANASSSGVSNLYGCISTDTSIKPEDCQVKAILQFPLF